MAATLSGGEAGAILLIVIVRVLATGGQVLAQALLSCADNWLEADSARSHLEQVSQVEVDCQPRRMARPGRRDLLGAIDRVPVMDGQARCFIGSEGCSSAQIVVHRLAVMDQLRMSRRTNTWLAQRLRTSRVLLDIHGNSR